MSTDKRNLSLEFRSTSIKKLSSKSFSTNEKQILKNAKNEDGPPTLEGKKASSVERRMESLQESVAEKKLKFQAKCAAMLRVREFIESELDYGLEEENKKYKGALKAIYILVYNEYVYKLFKCYQDSEQEYHICQYLLYPDSEEHAEAAMKEVCAKCGILRSNINTITNQKVKFIGKLYNVFYKMILNNLYLSNGLKPKREAASDVIHADLMKKTDLKSQIETLFEKSGTQILKSSRSKSTRKRS